MELKLHTLDDIRRAYHEGEEATIALFMQPGRVHSMHQTAAIMMNDGIVTNIILNNGTDGAWNASYQA